MKKKWLNAQSVVKRKKKAKENMFWKERLSGVMIANQKKKKQTIPVNFAKHIFFVNK